MAIFIPERILPFVELINFSLGYYCLKLYLYKFIKSESLIIPNYINPEVQYFIFHYN